jgi:nucleoside-diphosphate-sugar epimerase
MRPDIRSVLVTGGAGYVGTVLVPKLLARGYRVKVLDLYLGVFLAQKLHGKPFTPETIEAATRKWFE